MSIHRVASLPALALLLACPGNDPAPETDGDTGTAGDGTTGSTSAGSADTTTSAPTGPAESSEGTDGSTSSADTNSTGETGEAGMSLFRVQTVGLVAPNFYLPGCSLANESLPFFIDPALVADEDGDGVYDLSIVAGMELEDPSGTIQFGEAECTTAPEACSLGATDFDTSFETVGDGECYVAEEERFITDGDVSVATVSAPCVAASDDALTINLGAFSLPLVHAVVATSTDADPPSTTMTTGTVEGFLTLDVANSTYLPENETFDALGISGEPLANFLPRPFFECETIPGYSMSPRGELGWYVLLTFGAAAVDSADG